MIMRANGTKEEARILCQSQLEGAMAGLQRNLGSAIRCDTIVEGDDGIKNRCDLGFYASAR